MLTLLNEPWPSDLSTTVHDSGAQTVLSALSPIELLAVTAGFALTAACARKTLRHPHRLAPHDRISGIRNATLPHTRARQAAVRADGRADGGADGQASDRTDGRADGQSAGQTGGQATERARATGRATGPLRSRWSGRPTTHRRTPPTVR